MDTAICGRVALSPNPVFHPKPGLTVLYFGVLWVRNDDELRKMVINMLSISNAQTGAFFGQYQPLQRGKVVVFWTYQPERKQTWSEAEFGVRLLFSFWYHGFVGFVFRKSRKISPPYRVMLHNDDYNKREYVVQVLMKVIPGMTVDNAVNIMQEAHINGLSVVIICAQADAEEHCTQLRGNGLRSSIEPASGGC
ncbi:hypothetical protein C3L33_04193, partial [Rhododendron williamsianum]